MSYEERNSFGCIELTVHPGCVIKVVDFCNLELKAYYHVMLLNLSITIYMGVIKNSGRRIAINLCVV